MQSNEIHWGLQVATDTRLWLMQQVQQMRENLADLMRVAVDRAEREVDVLLPGFTHLQPAMTVRWGHWLLSHAAAWQRDDMRLRDLQPRVAMMPLGSGDPKLTPARSCLSVRADLGSHTLSMFCIVNRHSCRCCHSPAGRPLGWRVGGGHPKHTHLLSISAGCC